MAYQATIEKQGLSTIFDIKGDASAVAKRLSQLGLTLPASANMSIEKDGQHLCWIGETHWLLLAPLAAHFDRGESDGGRLVTEPRTHGLLHDVPFQ